MRSITLIVLVGFVAVAYVTLETLIGAAAYSQ